jgi:type IV pilus biogenesis protein PilP
LEKARFQLERARKGIFDDSQTTQNQTGMPGMYNPPPMNITQQKTVSEDNKDINKTPLLAAVYGSSKLKAQFKLSDGSNIEASAGDVLPGGYQVKSISVDRVQLIHDGKVINVGS